MTLLFFDGFQDGSVMVKPEWATATAPGSSQTGRDGVANGSIQYTTQLGRTLALPTPAATVIAATAFKLGVMGLSGTNSAQIIVAQSDITTIQLVLLINGTTGLIEVRRASNTGTLLGTSSGHTPIGAGDWHHVAMKATLHTSTGIITVQLDGVTVLTLTGQATSSVIGNVTHLRQTGAASISGVMWDDWYVCDAVDATATQGRPNNDFLGDLKVAALFPSAAGDSTQWSPSTGSNFAAVGETPASVSDYVSDATTGHRDLYQVSDLVGSVTTVYGVREQIYGQKTDSGTITVKPVIKENSTVTVDSAQGLAISAASVTGAMKAVRPSDSGSWTVTDVNALQIGVEVG